MSKKKGKKEGKISSRLDLNSKFWKAFLTLLAAFLTFAGPTYIVYALINVVRIDHLISMISGIVLFISGLALIWFLIRNKIIS